MLKKVLITNVHTGAKHEAVVDTDTHEKALIGSGVASNESATIEDIVGVDETVHRLTLPKENLDDRVLFFNGLARCLERNIGLIKSLQLQANRVKSAIPNRTKHRQHRQGLPFSRAAAQWNFYHADLYTRSITIPSSGFPARTIIVPPPHDLNAVVVISRSGSFALYRRHPRDDVLNMSTATVHGHHVVRLIAAPSRNQYCASWAGHLKEVRSPACAVSERL